MTVSKRIEKEFTNQFGHTFKPGDPCISVTVSTGKTSIVRGKYVGVIPPATVGWSPRVQVKKPIRQFAYVYDDTGEIAHWPYQKDRSGQYKSITTEKICTLWNNNILPDTATVDDVAKVV